MRWSHLFLKFAVVVLALVFVAGGAYQIVNRYSLGTLKSAIEANLSQGNYLAALVGYNTLEKRAPDEAVAGKIEDVTRLLAAEQDFGKAKKAAKENAWADARAILSGSDAVVNPAFKQYQEAKKLYEEAEVRAANIAEKTAVTLGALEGEAKTERAKRVNLEKNQAALEGTLQEKEKSIREAQAETLDVAQKLEQSRKEAEQKQFALTAQEARTKALMAQVEEESRQKFFNEFKVYRDMTEKGKVQLENAIGELNGKRDVTALIYISQGRILLEEVKTKASDLRSSRTSTVYQTRVDDLVKSLDQFLEAAKHFRNAVVYIDDQSSGDFTNSITKANSAFLNAAALLSGVSDFLAAP